MPSAALGARLDRNVLGIGPRLSAIAVVLSRAGNRLLSPAPVAGLVLVSALTGMIASATTAASPSDVRRLESALFAQAAQLAQLREQLELSQRDGERLAAVQLFSAQHQIAANRAAAIYDASTVEGLRPDLAFRLVKIESGFRPTAVSPAGAIGLTQIKPSTAQWVDPTVTREMLFDTGTNLRVGFRYLKILLNQYSGNERLALLAYNRGPGRVRELLALGKDPANGYASRVLAR